MTLGVRLNQDIIFHSRHQPYLIFHFFFYAVFPVNSAWKLTIFIAPYYQPNSRNSSRKFVKNKEKKNFSFSHISLLNSLTVSKVWSFSKKYDQTFKTVIRELISDIPLLICGFRFFVLFCFVYFCFWDFKFTPYENEIFTKTVFERRHKEIINVVHFIDFRRVC